MDKQEKLAINGFCNSVKIVTEELIEILTKQGGSIKTIKLCSDLIKLKQEAILIQSGINNG